MLEMLVGTGSVILVLGILVAVFAAVGYYHARPCDGCGKHLLPWQEERMYGNIGTGYPPSYYHRTCAPS